MKARIPRSATPVPALLLIVACMTPPSTLAASANAAHPAFYVCQLRVPGPDGAASSERLYLSPVFAADGNDVTFAWTMYMTKRLELPSNASAYRYCQKSQREQDAQAVAVQWQQRAKSLGQQVTQVDWRYAPGP